MTDSVEELYKGEGNGKSRGKPLAPFKKLEGLDSPERYIADVGLRGAVNVAIMLGQPLLLTGEPGTGKSLLAHSVAFELEAGVPDDQGRLGPLVFHCKTTSTASDLFYRYDALRRFHDANQRTDELPSEESYVTYEALGLAILLGMPKEQADQYLPKQLRGLGPKRCVVLADEIDKAPRDLPNDILNEIDRMTFTVKETRKTFTAAEENKPILILTSNSERDLPEAFLRRCVFYHVPFPDNDWLKRILSNRLDQHKLPPSEEMYEAIVNRFEEIREIPGLRKKPATAELIAWAYLMVLHNTHREELEPKLSLSLLHTIPVLAKTQEDIDRIEKWIKSKADASNRAATD